MLYVFDVPMYGTITQMPHAEHENATDIACVTGRPVRAVTSGEGEVHYSPRMGWVFTLTSPSGKVVTSYSHLDVAYPPGMVRKRGRHRRVWQHGFVVNRAPSPLLVKRTLHVSRVKIPVRHFPTYDVQNTTTRRLQRGSH